MKAISYLQKLGALPKCDIWDLQMAIITIADEMFSHSTIVEPDCLEWVQSAAGVEGEGDSFEKRCNLILFATSGDVRALGPTLFSVTDEKVLEDLIKELLEVRLMFHGLSVGGEESFNVSENEDWFVSSFNEMAGLPPSEFFQSKSQILRFYYSGALSEIGETVIKRMIGSLEGFMMTIQGMEMKLEKFITKAGGGITGGAFENLGGNVLDGSHVRVIDVSFSGEEDFSVITLHWAPWPSVQIVEDNSSKLAALCAEFNDHCRSRWFEEFA